MDTEFEIGTPEWRLEHIRLGDAILDTLHSTAELTKISTPDKALKIRALAEVAQAHYAAANVRYRPQ